jgi:hypothetical protein
MKKKFIREPKNEVDTFLTRVNKVKQRPELFKEVYDISGNIVDPAKITRANEMTGAGIEYLTSFVDFICTHFRDTVDQSNVHYYVTPDFDWSAAIDIMTGGIPGQRERAEIAIMHYMAKPKQALVLCADGHYRSAQPFILVFDWGRKEDLDAKAAARLARLNKSKGKKPEKDDGSQRLPIAKVTVMFFKPLFEDFFKKDASTYSFPAGMYAKIFKITNDAKREGRKRLKDEVDTATSRKKNEILTTFDNETTLSAYTRFARYVIRHNNLTGKEKPDALGKLGRITLDTQDLIQSVYPSLIESKGEGKRRILWDQFQNFLIQAMAIYWNIPDFQFYPSVNIADINGSMSGEKIAFDLYKTPDQARKTLAASVITAKLNAGMV